MFIHQYHISNNDVVMTLMNIIFCVCTVKNFKLFEQNGELNFSYLLHKKSTAIHDKKSSFY